MRAKSIVLLLIAGACGLIASISISQVIERNNNPGEVPMGELFVAVTDIDIGAKLDATNVKLDKWPKDRIPEGAINKVEDLKDKFPRVRLYAGEPILTAKLMDSNSGVDRATKIPEGYRVVSVKVTMDEVVSGLVQPGDRVDVVMFVRKNDEIGKTAAHTILKEVRVFAINSETERSTDANGDQMVAKTVSLLVKPNQVESVMLAAELGKLRLSLRRPNDTTEMHDDDGTDIEELLGSTDRRGVEKNDQAMPGGIMDLIKPQPATEPIAATPVFEAPREPQFRMMILTPSGPQQFQWDDLRGLPQPVGATETSSPSPAALPLAPIPLNPAAPPAPADAAAEFDGGSDDGATVTDR